MERWLPFLLLLPVAGKIKARAHHRAQMRELVLEGVAGIVEGLNPKLIRTKLEAYVRGPAPAAGPKVAAKASEAVEA